MNILVVGAGPTGLTIASELYRHGLTCRIIDALPEGCLESRALAIHARTMEMLESMDTVQPFLDEGHKLLGLSIMAHGKRLLQISFEELESQYRFVLSLPQNKTERILAEHLERLGGKVERAIKLRALSQAPDAVTVALVHNDGKLETEKFDWVIGCDGAHSAVRHSLSASFAGSPYPDLFSLVDADITASDFDFSRAHVFQSDDGVVAIFPLGQIHARVIANIEKATPSDEAVVQGRNDPKPPPPTLEQMQEMLDRRGPGGIKLSNANWLASFSIQRRLVQEYRFGNVLLAGDAAHVHSPVGGQGMNTGMQDAYNLAWKLALVCKGAARPALLDSYHSERHSVGTTILKQTDFLTRVNVMHNPIVQSLRDKLAPVLTSLEVVQDRMKKEVSELAINYRHSPIVSEKRVNISQAKLIGHSTGEQPELAEWFDFGHGPHAGDRAPDAHLINPQSYEHIRLFELLRGTEHHLLLLSGVRTTSVGMHSLSEVANSVIDRYAQFIKVHIIGRDPDTVKNIDWTGSCLLDLDLSLHHRYKGSAECLYLIRPDHYIGFRSLPADKLALHAYLETLFV